MAERGRGEATTLGEAETTGGDGLEGLAVAGRVDEDGHRRVVLGRRAHHRGPADVDLLDAGVVVRPGGDRVGEGIEVDDDELERLHVQVRDLLEMLGLSRVRQDAGMDPRVQGLDPAFEALREPGQRVDRGHVDAGLRDPLGGGPGGDDLDARVRQTAGELGEPGLVVDADEGAAYGPAGVVRLGGHDMYTFRPSIWRRPRAAAVRTSTSISRSRTLMRSWRVASVSSGRTSTARWSITGPVSTPASTR